VTGATQASTTYGYDTLNRLTSATIGGATTSWTYDGVGNRLTQTGPGGLTSYTYNSDDELTSDGTNSYNYDSNGNQTTAGANTFAYDLANRLLSASVSGATSNYSYDGDGLRLSSTIASSTTNFLWDPGAGLPQLDAEQTSSGTDIRSYLYGAGLVSMASGGSTYYYHSGDLGSITNVTDASGNPQWSYSYDAWGNPTATQDAGGAPSNPIQFAGGYADPTGLTLFGVRQYSSNTGRFLTTDPANLAPGSTYAYVDDQPTAAVDPTGLGALDWLKKVYTGVARGASSWVSTAVQAFLPFVQGYPAGVGSEWRWIKNTAGCVSKAVGETFGSIARNPAVLLDRPLDTASLSPVFTVGTSSSTRSLPPRRRECLPGSRIPLTPALVD
jgi:RHS repeat-associated protein